MQVVKAHPLFPYLLEKRLAIPTSPFHLLVNGVSVTTFRNFFEYSLGSNGGWGDVVLVHIVQLKPTIKAQISGRMISITSVYSDKNSLKKLIMIIISQETAVFGGRQKLTSAMKLRPEK